GEDPHDAITERIETAANQTFDELLASHQADYKELFDRVDLDIGQAVPNIPTDQLLKGYTGEGNNANDRALEALFFQHGSYLLISVSRDGCLPANLQGIWNNYTKTPWSAYYHTNINIQMNYCTADVNK